MDPKILGSKLGPLLLNDLLDAHDERGVWTDLLLDKLVFSKGEDDIISVRLGFD